jgi:hypothetical protein
MMMHKTVKKREKKRQRMSHTFRYSHVLRRQHYDAQNNGETQTIRDIHAWVRLKTILTSLTHYHLVA